MKKKVRKPAYKPTLHIGEAVPITDLAVQAAMEEMRHMEKPVVPLIVRDYFKKYDEDKKAGKRKIRSKP